MTQEPADSSTDASELATPRPLDATAATPEPAPGTSRGTRSGASSFVAGCAAVATVLGVLLLVAMLGWLLIADHVKYVHAAMFRPVAAGVVSQSMVEPNPRRPRDLRKLRNLQHKGWPRIAVEYSVDGSPFRTETIVGYERAFVWRPTPEQMVAAHPVGSSVRVRYDRDDPSRGAIDFGPEGWQLWELLVLLPAVGGGGLLVHEWLERRRRRTAALPIACRQDPAGRTVLRMAPSTPARWAVKGLALGTVAAMGATLLFAGRQPTIATVGWALLGAVTAGALGGLGSLLWISLGHHDLAVDALRRILILPPSATAPPALAEGVPFAEISSIAVVQSIDQSGSRIRVSLRNRLDLPSTIDLPPLPLGEGQMAALASWLRTEVGLRDTGRER